MFLFWAIYILVSLSYISIILQYILISNRANLSHPFHPFSSFSQFTDVRTHVFEIGSSGRVSLSRWQAG